MTDVGKVRPTNEDHFLVARLAKALQVEHTSLPQPSLRQGGDQSYLFLVADGMGGHAGGERASALTVDSIESCVLNTFKWFFQLEGGEENAVLAEFQDALRSADAHLFDEVSRHPELTGMGTTLTLAYTLGVKLFVAHVGDSRCYLFRKGELHRLTHDHTMVQEMVRAGHLKAKEADTNQFRHVVTNVVGGHTPGVHIEVHKVDLEEGDKLLLCTDGLTEMVADKDIAGLLAGFTSSRESCQRMIKLANAQGGRDNITAVVASFK
jgi:protein phosphatase